MAILDGIVGGFIGAIVGGFSNFFAQRYFFNRLSKGLDKFERKILHLFKGELK